MTMTQGQMLATIALIALGTAATRFLPFLLFPAHRPTPAFVRHLGRVLPAAVMGMLVIYCLRDVSLLAGSHGLPEAMAIAVIAALHCWKRQTLLSIAAGTVTYMLLVQLVF